MQEQITCVADFPAYSGLPTKVSAATNDTKKNDNRTVALGLVNSFYGWDAGEVATPEPLKHKEFVKIYDFGKMPWFPKRKDGKTINFPYDDLKKDSLELEFPKTTAGVVGVMAGRCTFSNTIYVGLVVDKLVLQLFLWTKKQQERNH